jgi:hypothetical protein
MKLKNKKLKKAVNEYIEERKEHFTEYGWELDWTFELGDILHKLEPDFTNKLINQLSKKLDIQLLSDHIFNVPTDRRKRKQIIHFTIGFKNGLVYYNTKQNKLKVTKDTYFHDDWEYIGGL